MKTISKIIVITLAILNISCEDVFEKDISNNTAQIISPINGQKIESNIVKFQWGKMNGADKYRIQVFDNNQSIVLDSLSDKTNLAYPLLQGNYSWRVRGENFAYTSIYSFPSAFSTIISNDLTNQVVTLSSPQNDIYINFTNITLNWQLIPNATSYSVEVINVKNGQQVFVNTSPITKTSVTFDIPDKTGGLYEWRVKAKNSTTETVQYSSRKINIDTVAPNQTQNQTPVNNSIQVVNQQLTFGWLAVTDTGIIQSPISYKIEFSNDENFSLVTQTSTTNSTSFLQTFTKSGAYFWRVKTTDEAGNVSTPSATFKFTIN